MTPEEADKMHEWAGMNGAIAWHLIDRYADNWNEAGMMMDAWRRANTPKTGKCRACGHEHELPSNVKGEGRGAGLPA